jgi:hypothetical protein
MWQVSSCRCREGRRAAGCARSVPRAGVCADNFLERRAPLEAAPQGIGIQQFVSDPLYFDLPRIRGERHRSGAKIEVLVEGFLRSIAAHLGEAYRMDKPRLLEAPIACTSFCWIASSNNCWTTRRGSLMRLARSRTVSQPSTLMNFNNKLSRLRPEIPVAESPFGAAGAPWITDESCSSVKYPRAIRFAPKRPPFVFWRSSASESAASVTSSRFNSISPRRISDAH